MILETHFDLRVNQFLDRNRIEKSQEVVLLGITIDDKLSLRNAYWKYLSNSKIKITRVTTYKKVFKYRCKLFNLQCFYKRPVLLCPIKLDACREIVNLRSTKNQFSIVSARMLRNESRQSSQLLITFQLKLDITNTIWFILNWRYKSTPCIRQLQCFKKSSGFLEWEPFSTNSEI